MDRSVFWGFTSSFLAVSVSGIFTRVELGVGCGDTGNEGSKERKQREKKKPNDSSTSARASFMAPLHFASHDLLLKYRL